MITSKQLESYIAEEMAKFIVENRPKIIKRAMKRLKEESRKAKKALDGKT